MIFSKNLLQFCLNHGDIDLLSLECHFKFWEKTKVTRQFLVSFLVFLNFLTPVNKILLMFLNQQARHESGGNLQHFQIVFQNALNWTTWNSRHVSSFMNSESSVFEDKLLRSSHIPICFAHWWMSWDFRIFNRVYKALEWFRNHSKSCLLPIVCSPRAASIILTVSISIYSI